MDNQIKLGAMNTLKIDRQTDPGMFLTAGDGETILLPNRYVTKKMKVGDEICVFVTTDSEDRLVALTDKPKAMVDEFGYFEVVASEPFGAFVNWGLPKDLFVPLKNQKTPFRIGDKRILRVVYDKVTDRLAGDEHVGRYLFKDMSKLVPKQEVKLLLLAYTPLGFKVIVDNMYEGMIFHSEIFQKVYVGESMTGYVKHVREDGKLDISLQPIGEVRKDVASKKVLEVLKKNGGKMNFTYKSEAPEIMKAFALSKKNFKFALTKLIEAKLIALHETGISVI